MGLGVGRVAGQGHSVVCFAKGAYAVGVGRNVDCKLLYVFHAVVHLVVHIQQQEKVAFTVSSRQSTYWHETAYGIIIL
jgi:hypothetical protein